MPEYKYEKYEAVINVQYTFYKLYINGKCQFDEFEKEVRKNKNLLNDWAGIHERMERYSDRVPMPLSKFNHIVGVGRNDIYEFKSKSLRVYVVKKSPDIIIVLGGYKVSQKKDINLLKERLKSFK